MGNIEQRDASIPIPQKAVPATPPRDVAGVVDTETIRRIRGWHNVKRFYTSIVMPHETVYRSGCVVKISRNISGVVDTHRMRCGSARNIKDGKALRYRGCG